MNIFSELVQKLAGTHKVAMVKTCNCEVISVNIGDRTCQVRSVESNHELEDFTVYLTPEVSNSELDIPTIGSTVSVIFTDFTPPYVVKCSELDEKYIMAGDQMYFIKDGLQQFNDGSFGGIGKMIELEKQLNATIEVITAIVNSLENWTVSPSDGGAALKAYFATQIIGKTVGNFSDIQNKNITHGPRFSP